MTPIPQAIADAFNGKDRFAALNSHAWTEVLPAPLSDTDHNRVQDALDELVGLHPDGGKLLKLAWNPHTEMWDSAMREYRPYLFWKKEFQGLIHLEGVLQRETVNIGVPRYIILGRVPPEQQTQTADRTYSEVAARVLIEVEPGQWERDWATDQIEEKAGADQWKPLLTICQHSLQYNHAARSPQCCVNLLREKKHCYGEYRPPDDMDLEMLGGTLNFWAQKLQAAAHEAFTAKDKYTVFQHYMEQVQSQQKHTAAEAEYITNGAATIATKNPIYLT